jgi:hypothetical protein
MAPFREGDPSGTQGTDANFNQKTEIAFSAALTNPQHTTGLSQAQN